MKRAAAFFLGMREFLMGSTQSYDDEVLLEWYDRGRDLAHRLTLRKFEA